MFPRASFMSGDTVSDRGHRAHIAVRTPMRSMVSLVIPVLMTPGGCALRLSGDLLDRGRSAQGEETLQPSGITGLQHKGCDKPAEYRMCPRSTALGARVIGRACAGRKEVVRPSFGACVVLYNRRALFARGMLNRRKGGMQMKRTRYLLTFGLLLLSMLMPGTLTASSVGDAVAPLQP